MTTRLLRYLLIGVFASFLVSCASSQATYFRKLNASVEDERRDWGLCGGDFYPSGLVKPQVSESILQCMVSKGYETLNDYYIEEHIGFVRRDKLEDYYIPIATLSNCGMTWLESGAICKHQGFVLRETLPSFVNCMSRAGYALALPRYKMGILIVNDLDTLSPLFCAFLTPRNQQGGMSLGNRRTN